MKKILTAAIVTVVAAMTASAQNETTPGLIWSALHNIEYEVNAGVNIGGTSPLPLPAEIRSIDSYSPNLSLSIGATATKWFGSTKRWGIVLGVGLDTKGMQTRRHGEELRHGDNPGRRPRERQLDRQGQDPLSRNIAHRAADGFIQVQSPVQAGGRAVYSLAVQRRVPGLCQRWLHARGRPYGQQGSVRGRQGSPLRFFVGNCASCSGAARSAPPGMRSSTSPSTAT